MNKNIDDKIVELIEKNEKNLSFRDIPDNWDLGKRS